MSVRRTCLDFIVSVLPMKRKTKKQKRRSVVELTDCAIEINSLTPRDVSVWTS